jgi:hypothetical protein
LIRQEREPPKKEPVLSTILRIGTDVKAKKGKKTKVEREVF